MASPISAPCRVRSAAPQGSPTILNTVPPQSVRRMEHWLRVWEPHDLALQLISPATKHQIGIANRENQALETCHLPSRRAEPVEQNLSGDVLQQQNLKIFQDQGVVVESLISSSG